MHILRTFQAKAHTHTTAVALSKVPLEISAALDPDFDQIENCQMGNWCVDLKIVAPGAGIAPGKDITACVTKITWLASAVLTSLKPVGRPAQG